MKIKISNKLRNIIIIVLLVAFIFIVLGTINYNYQEGYTDASGNEVPKCDSSYSDDEDEMHENWFLKTRMVPPVCPTCLYDFSLDKKEDDKKEEDTGNDDKKENDNGDVVYRDKYDDSYKDNSINQKLINQNDNSVNQKLINQNDNSINNRNDNSINQTGNSADTNINQTQSADNKWNNLFGNNSITFGGNTSVPSYNTSQIGSLAGSGPAPYGTPSVSTPAQVGNSSQVRNNANNKGSCPPCERCPEPAFECKKVPNYRSSSINNYMPLPILNDFSRF